jgi:hypothetical protein
MRSGGVVVDPREAVYWPTNDYTSPRRECDVIMKGGITRGVVSVIVTTSPATAVSYARRRRFDSASGM